MRVFSEVAVLRSNQVYADWVHLSVKYAQIVNRCACQSMNNESARERTARQRRREWRRRWLRLLRALRGPGRLRRLRVGLIGRRRGGALADDLLRLGSRRRGGECRPLQLRRRNRAPRPARWRPWPAACPCPWISRRAWTSALPAAVSALRRRQLPGRPVPAAAARRCPCRVPSGRPARGPGTPSGNTGLRSPGSFFLVSSQSKTSLGSQL